jgi:hypothetical protein
MTSLDEFARTRQACPAAASQRGHLSGERQSIAVIRLTSLQSKARMLPQFSLGKTRERLTDEQKVPGAY